MLILANLELKRLKLRLDANPSLESLVTKTSDYSEVRSSVLEIGIRDPLLVRYYPDHSLLVETGVQRTLIARELGIFNLMAFVYPFPDPLAPMPNLHGKKIMTVAGILSEFQSQDVSVCIDLLDYVRRGTIIL